MDELLSPEEKNALFGMPAPARPDAPAVTPAVFPSVSQLGPERIETLCGVLKTWAERVAEHLSTQLRAPLQIQAPRIQTVSRAGLPQVGDEPLWCAVAGTEHLLVVSLHRAFAVAACDRIFGAPLQPADDRPLARSERRLIEEFGALWSAALGRVWGQPIQLRPAPEILSDPEGAAHWLHFTCDLVHPALAGACGVTLAPSTARLLLGESGGKAQDPVTPATLGEKLGEVPIELRAVLGHAEFSLDDLASLRVGDVIALDQRVQQPIEIIIAGKSCFQARAGLSGKVVALEIVE